MSPLRLRCAPARYRGVFELFERAAPNDMFHDPWLRRYAYCDGSAADLDVDAAVSPR